jgi:GT2 family glycosyltransferase
MMILPMTPWSRKADGMNLGAAYNAAMALLPALDDWAIFRDHDMMTVTRSWVDQFAEAIELVPDAGAIVAVTNRIDAAWQRASEVDKDNHDMEYHVAIGAARMKRRTLLDITDTKGFGGVLFAVSKAAWLEAGGFADGLLCVDHSLHFRTRAAGRRIYLHEGIYCYHLRRAFVGKLPDETPRVANCPCRGAEPMPTVRLTIPEQVTA